ncbi:unnamed protein product [Arabidopsis thaliana]|uniref:TF-B3 domain-containing protein n=2 Tax=Arabidopsis thaliana TaxID=3702 RepID=A0A5S9WN69_ARATH|nr:unnamed protein product [Arabidopsis thaliana]
MKIKHWDRWLASLKDDDYLKNIEAIKLYLAVMSIYEPDLLDEYMIDDDFHPMISRLKNVTLDVTSARFKELYITESKMNYARDELDGAMIISKTLTKSDIVGNVALPKAQVMSVLTRMNGVTDEGLDNGFEVQVHDIMEDDLYTVTLKRIDDMKYYFGTGWSTMRHSLDLVEGDVLKLYWDQFENKFIVLNFQHKTMGIMIPV